MTRMASVGWRRSVWLFAAWLAILAWGKPLPSAPSLSTQRRPVGMLLVRATFTSLERLMAHLPTGTVTFLFSDIQGSTDLVTRLGERYAPLVLVHRQLLRAALQRHHGHELGTEGDSFFV